MRDWRAISNSSNTRVREATGNGSDKGIFQGIMDSISSEKQTARLRFPNGEKTITLPMPFEGADSWIRSIPTGGFALIGKRSDTQDQVFLRYIDESAEIRLSKYAEGVGIYRPLLPGEHEIQSAGMAQSYYSSRPYLEHKGGAIRSWLDQDKAEAGQKAPTHTRQLWEHVSGEIGDEERFGAVKRPIELNILNQVAISLQTLKEGNFKYSMTSYNYQDYPYPEVQLPGGFFFGGAPGAAALAAQGLAKASEVAGLVTGSFKKRVFAKEYLRVLKNPLGYPKKLIDIREGQVFADNKNPLISGELSAPNGQAFGENFTYLRARYQYFTTVGDKTSLEIDELGNVNWSLSIAAAAPNGFKTTVPLGGWKLITGTDIDMKAGLSITGMALKDVSFTSLLTASTTSTQVSLTSYAKMALDSKGVIGMSSILNTSIDSKLSLMMSGKALAKLSSDVLTQIQGKIIQIGEDSAADPCVLGMKFSQWLIELLNAFVTAAPAFTMGNLGYPTPLNPTLQAAISKAITTVPTWLSKQTFVGPK